MRSVPRTHIEPEHGERAGFEFGGKNVEPRQEGWGVWYPHTKHWNGDIEAAPGSHRDAATTQGPTVQGTDRRPVF